MIISLCLKRKYYQTTFKLPAEHSCFYQRIVMRFYRKAEDTRGRNSKTFTWLLSQDENRHQSVEQPTPRSFYTPCLPLDVVTSQSLSTFKERLKHFCSNSHTADVHRLCHLPSVVQWRRNNVESGAPIRREAPENFCCCATPLFGSKSTISRFGKCFRDGQYSLFSFLFAVLLLTVPFPVLSHL